MTHPCQNTPTAKLIGDRIRDLSHRKTQAEIASEAHGALSRGAAGDLREASYGVFTLPTPPSGVWEQLTENETASIVYISCVSDPRFTPARVRALRELRDKR